jgi:hypothetical protein
MQNDIEIALLDLNNLTQDRVVQTNINVGNLPTQPTIKQQALLFGTSKVLAGAITNVVQLNYPNVDTLAFKNIFAFLLSYSGQKLFFSKKFSQEETMLMQGITTNVLANIVSGIAIGKASMLTTSINNEIGLNPNYQQYLQDFIVTSTWIASEMGATKYLKPSVDKAVDCNSQKTKFVSNELLALGINVLSAATAAYIAVSTMKDVKTNDALEQIMLDGTIGAIFATVKSTMKYGLNYLSKRVLNESSEIGR